MKAKKATELAIGSIKTPRLGQVWVALSRGGLVTVEYGADRATFEKTVRQQMRGEVCFDSRRGHADVAEAALQIAEYLRGRRQIFDIDIDWTVLTSDFQRLALRAVMAIPYGETRTYGQIAAAIGHPDAPRAVGRANATNPMPLVIPCHRVIGSDGKLHGYGGRGGLKAKRWLLDLEHSHA